jgi:ABC-2 type transport system ATP-binding protein
VLSVRRVTKWFGARRVLDDVSLEVERGERVVLFGDNGCGKSTLLQLVTGVIETYEGTIRAPFPIGYAPEKPDIPDHLLGHEWLDLVASLKGCAWHRELGVDALLGCEVGAMSLGQRQRISLVAALTGAPELLVLDEPTNALDVDARSELVERLHTSTALIATHDRDFAACVATRVITLPSRAA